MTIAGNKNRRARGAKGTGMTINGRLLAAIAQFVVAGTAVASAAGWLPDGVMLTKILLGIAAASSAAGGLAANPKNVPTLKS